MRLSPNTPISQTRDLSIADFWSWAYSDLLSNRNRGIFAEFLVGAALDVLDRTRIEWDAYDLHYKDRRIEVKSAAYLQSWQQTRPSSIGFDIAPKLSWDATDNTYDTQATRSADIYVFCLFAEQNRELANVIDPAQWEFFVLPVRVLDEKLGTQKRIGLRPLRQICESVDYPDLKGAVDTLLSHESRTALPPRS
jgi:hypothetical protein